VQRSRSGRVPKGLRDAGGESPQAGGGARDLLDRPVDLLLGVCPSVPKRTEPKARSRRHPSPLRRPRLRRAAAHAEPLDAEMPASPGRGPLPVEVVEGHVQIAGKTPVRGPFTAMPGTFARRPCRSRSRSKSAGPRPEDTLSFARRHATPGRRSPRRWESPTAGSSPALRPQRARTILWRAGRRGRPPLGP